MSSLGSKQPLGCSINCNKREVKGAVEERPHLEVPYTVITIIPVVRLLLTT